MELVGDEKRIQALFSELKFQDQSIAPAFNRLWNSVQPTKPKRMALFHPMAVFATLTLFGTLCAVALWSNQSSNVNVRFALDRVPVASGLVVTVDVEPAKKLSRKSHRPAVRKIFRPTEFERGEIEQAAVLSSWQAPTDSLMDGASSAVVKTLPEFTQAVKDLESYLSNNGFEEFK